MRTVTSYLFISLDGVVEAPERFLREDLYEDVSPLIGETIAEQDAVLLGRTTYEAWSAFWPDSPIEPFAGFINGAPKYVVSKTLTTLDWPGSSLISADLHDAVTSLKRQAGRTVGVHGSVSLVQGLLSAGLLDELRLVVCPVIAGEGRRLLSREGEPIQLDLRSARTTPRGLQFLVLRPRD